MKKIQLLIASLFVVLSLFGCSKSEQWSIDINSSKEYNSLVTDEEIIDYSGNASTVTHENKPSANTKFIIVNLTIKDVDSVDEFVPTNLSLTDGTNTYNRLDDSFLDTHGLEQLSTYPIQFGESSGYAAFEVPTDVELSSLSIIYKTENIDIKKKLN